MCDGLDWQSIGIAETQQTILNLFCHQHTILNQQTIFNKAF